MHLAIIIGTVFSFIVYLAMGQIAYHARSTERISSFTVCRFLYHLPVRLFNPAVKLQYSE